MWLIYEILDDNLYNNVVKGAVQTVPLLLTCLFNCVYIHISFVLMSLYCLLVYSIVCIYIYPSHWCPFITYLFIQLCIFTYILRIDVPFLLTCLFNCVYIHISFVLMSLYYLLAHSIVCIYIYPSCWCLVCWESFFIWGDTTYTYMYAGIWRYKHVYVL